MPLNKQKPDSLQRKRLKRDIEREALTRLEESARTEKEFENVGKWWDKRDSNRERRERYYEQLIDNDMFDWNFEEWVRYEEDLISVIFMCPCEMHLLTYDHDVSLLINKATAKQKAVFFPRYMLGCSTTKISKCHDMSDRNARKLTDKMIENVQKGLYEVLVKRSEAKESLSLRQRLFLDAYSVKGKSKLVSITSYIEKAKTKISKNRKSDVDKTSGE